MKAMLIISALGVGLIIVPSWIIYGYEPGLAWALVVVAVIDIIVVIDTLRVRKKK